MTIGWAESSLPAQHQELCLTYKNTKLYKDEQKLVCCGGAQQRQKKTLFQILSNIFFFFLLSHNLSHLNYMHISVYVAVCIVSWYMNHLLLVLPSFSISSRKENDYLNVFGKHWNDNTFVIKIHYTESFAHHPFIASNKTLSSGLLHYCYNLHYATLHFPYCVLALRGGNANAWNSLWICFTIIYRVEFPSRVEDNITLG